MSTTEPVRPRLSVVLPAYNEEGRLPATLVAWHVYLSSQPYAWEIVVADDGSRDATAQIAEALAETHSGIRVLRLVPNRGKGGAVRAGVLAADGEIVLYADSDMNVPAAFVAEALAVIDGGADVAVGERSLRTYASEERSAVRLLAGLAVQVSRRALALTFVRDSQCGFKAFRRAAAAAIFGRARIDSFAFDIEILYLARRLGIRTRTFPVDVAFRAGSTYDVRKHLPPFLADLWRVRVNAWRGVYN